MLKNKFKVIALIFTIVALITTFSFATDVATNSLENTVTNNTEDEATPIATNEEENTNTETQDIHEDDLYLVGDSIVMDKLVDGNVYIVGKDVKITGQVSGNLFVIADKLSFDNSYIRYSVFACANEINLNGACNDLYVACNKMTVSYDSYVIRDVRIYAADLTFKGAVGRDAYITANNLNFGEGDSQEVALIYGDLNYSTPSEVNIPEGSVEGTVSYNELKDNQSANKTVKDYIFSLLEAIIFTIIIYLLALWITPKFTKASSAFVSVKALPALGVGILTLILVPIVCILLLLIEITVPVSIALFTLYALLISISFAVVSICITKALKSRLSMDKASMEFLILALVAIVLWGLKSIPFIGWVVSLLIISVGLGIMVLYAITKNLDKKSDK